MKIAIGNDHGGVALKQHLVRYLEENGFEVTGAEFTRIPNDLKDVTAEQRETIDKMVEKLEDFDDVQTVYTNMKPEEITD
jgi:transcriptional/translational regulatory protein YebC/TACO1